MKKKHALLKKDGIHHNEDAVALHKDTEKFVHKMYKKYPNFHPYDIALVISGGVHNITTLDVLMNRY